MEEEGLDELKLGKFKTDSLRKSMDLVSSKASSILMLTLKWKDLEEHYDKVQKGLEEKAKEFGLMQEEAETTKKVVEERREEIVLKEKEFSSLEAQIQECSGQLDEKRKELALVEGQLGECSLQVESRGKELKFMIKSVEDCSTELELKKEELYSLKKSVEECCEEWQGKEKKLASVKEELGSCCQQINVKKEELGSVLKLFEKHQEELRLKERRLEVVKRILDRYSEDASERTKQIDVLQSSLKELSREHELRERELDSKRRLVKASEDDLELKKEKLELLRDLTTKCSSQLDVKQKELTSCQELIEEKSKEIKDKEQHVSSLESLIQDYSEELVNKENKYDLINKSLTNCSSELKSKRQELGFINSSIIDRSKKLDLEKKELDKVQLEIREAEIRVLSKRKELDSVEATLRSYSDDLELKQREFNGLSKCIKEGEKQLQINNPSVEECTNELTVKKEQLAAIEKTIQKCSNKVQSKELHLVRIKKCLEDLSVQIESKEQEFFSIELAHSEHLKELELKEKQNDSLKKSLDERFIEIEMKERQLQGCVSKLELKEKQVNSVQKAVEGQRQELELKEKLIYSQKTLLDERSRELHVKEGQLQGLSKELESKEKQMDIVWQAVQEQRKELGLKEQFNDLQKRSLQEFFLKLDIKEQQLQKRFKELESKEKQMVAFQQAVEEKRRDLELKERQLTETIHSEIEIEKLDHPLSTTPADSQSTGAQLVPMMDGSSLQFLLIELLKKHDLVHRKISCVIKMASDPAKLVLDAMRGFYPPLFREGTVEFDTDIVRKSCILLLDQLILNSPQIRPQLQQVALKVAHEWKAQMTVGSENQLEILGFLHLLAAFRLAFAFNVDEVQALLDLVADQKQALKLRQLLVITGKATASRIPHQLKTEQLDHLMISNANETFASDQIAVASWHLYEPALTEDDILSAVQISPDPAKFVLDVIQDWQIQYMKKDQSHEAGFHDAALKLYVLMLEQIMQISPLVQADVKVNAIKLAVEWKEKLKPDAKNSLEVLVFLEFIAAYGLISFLNLDRHEGLQLLQIIAPHKQASAICRAINFVDLLSDAIGSLVAKRQYIEAVRIVCAFELRDKFSPAKLLEKYTEEINQLAVDICNKGENSLEAQCQAIDEKIASLREIIECIRDFKLESEISSQVLETCITELGKKKVNVRCSAAAPTCKVQGEVQGQKDHGTGAGACASTAQLQLQGPVKASASRDKQPELATKKFSAAVPCTVQSQVQDRSNHPPQTCAPMVQPKLQHPVNAPASRDQQPRWGNKRPRTVGPVITPWVPSVTKPCVNLPTSQPGLGVSPMRILARLGLSPNQVGTAPNVSSSNWSTSRTQQLSKP